jgi:hypothetical protein
MMKHTFDMRLLLPLFSVVESERTNLNTVTEKVRASSEAWFGRTLRAPRLGHLYYSEN